MPEPVEVASFRVKHLETGIRGTVKYVGSVQDHEGSWYGVDWDEDSAGKHDGSYKGRQYFAATLPKSGSFVRPTKVTRGCTVMEAVSEKYAEEIEEDEFVIGNKKVELIGMHRVAVTSSCFNSITRLYLSNTEVASKGPDDLARLLPRVEELDLSFSLLASWEDVLAICLSWPRLKHIYLNNNSLTSLKSVDGLQDRLKRLQTIVLHRTGISWHELCTLSVIWPNVKDIGLAGNGIGSLSSPGSFGVLAQLESIDLSENPLPWEEALKLGGLKRLKFLNVCSCLVTSIEVTDGQFEALETLHVTNNEISDWHSVNELAKVPCLTDLRLARNPVTTVKEEANTLTEAELDVRCRSLRQQVVASIGTLQVLDKNRVDREERRGAEIDYLKLYANSYWTAKRDGTMDTFLSGHPRFGQLLKLYGEPDDAKHNSIRSGALHGDQIEVMIRYTCAVTGTETEQAKKLPRKITIQRLKALAARLAKRDVRSVSLVCLQKIRPNVSYPLDNDSRELKFYDVADGDIIAVQ